MSKRPYTIRGTERFATSRSQGSGSAAGRAVGGKIASAGGCGVSGNQRPELSFILPAVRDAAKGECEGKKFPPDSPLGHTTPTASAFYLCAGFSPCSRVFDPESFMVARSAIASVLLAALMECPNCGGDIRLIAFITEPGPINCPTSTSKASDGIPCHGADRLQEERFQYRSAFTRKIRP